ncbi:deoxyribonuclease IV [Paenibacillaceae bacterium]|nr:deoxyribonuclease IV [Paenibacillaceae bacterium]
MAAAGSHVSIGGGYLQAAKSALAQGGRAFQYFPKNPRSLLVKRFDPADAAHCARFCHEHQMASIAHSPYPTNLAVEDAARLQATVASLLNDLHIAEACGSVGTVVHFGIYKGSDPLQGYKNIIHCLNETLAQWEGRAKLLIENQSGEHARMGMTFEELAQIRALTRYPERIGYCLDTCHLLASGVWDGQPDMNWLDRARTTGVLEHLGAVHLNDSLYPSGSYRDRHAVIGEGHIGTEALIAFLAIPEVRSVPIVLETPKGKDGTHKAQIDLLNEWLSD